MAYIYSRYDFQDLLCSGAKNGRIFVKCLILLKECNIDIGIGINVILIIPHGMQVQYNFLEGSVQGVPLSG